MGFKLSVKNIAGVAAAPFTGGASLLATDLGKDALGEITGSNAAKKANAANIEQQNYWNNKQIELANTEVQRRYADLKAAGLNPVLAATNGATTPAVGAATVENTMPGGYMSQAGQGAAILSTLAQAKNLGVNSALQTAQTANTNAQTAQTQLDTAIKKDMKPATIAQAYQNVENAVAQQNLIQAQTAQSAEQANKLIEETRKIKGGKGAEYLGTDFNEWVNPNEGGKTYINTKYFYPN